jgi:hypothetical protein
MSAINIITSINKIIPLKLEKFLLSRGWVEDGYVGDKAKVWHRQEEEHFDLEIIQPLDNRLRDYSQRMYEIIQVLSEFEVKELAGILDEIVNFDSDIVKVRVMSPDVDNGSIPLGDGVLLFEKARDLLVSTTLSTFKKNRYFSGAWPADVKDFLGTLKLGQTEYGSYIVNVIAPIVISSENREGERSSITREVSNNLARSLVATTTAVTKYEASEDLIVFEEAINNGVSANLCDALIGISGSKGHRDIEISIQLAGVEENFQEIIKKHYFLSRHISVLKIASEYYKGNYTIERYSVCGLVIRMDHTPSEDYGVIRVASLVNGSLKNISIQLDLNDYWLAVRAHESNELVKCLGVLMVTSRTANLMDPKGFEVIEDQDLFDESTE